VYFYAAVLLATAGLGARDAVAQACDPGAFEICVFDSANFTGSSARMIRGISSTAGGTIFGTYFSPATFPVPVLNDWIGSIKVGSNVRARICTDSFWNGSCFNLTPGGWFDLGGWNNAISSVRIDWTDQSCWDGANWPVFPNEVSVHEHPNQTGDCTTKDQIGVEYPHQGFLGIRNDTMSSARVGEFTQAVICRHPNQGAPCTVFINGQPSPANFNMSGTPCGNDAATSIEIGTAPF
jgi:hypothetical protein